MRVMAAATVLAMIAVVLAVAVPVSDGADPGPLPQEMYPDADFIISEDAKGAVLVTHRVSEATGDTPAEYETRTVRAGSNLTVTDWSDIDGDVLIVMDGGRLGTLTLVNVDKHPKVESPVDITFDMVSGELNRLLAVGVQTSVAISLPNSHFTAYCPVDSLDIRIDGSVREFCTTDELIEITDLSIVLADNARVDRFFPTGEDGSYVMVEVSVEGATVGYMTNQRAFVTYMDYQLRAGSISYLCLGADTEGGSGYYQSNMWTFYVQRDARIHIHPGMDLGTAVVGGGIMDVPAVLSSGEAPEKRLERVVEIDAPGHDIGMYTCFPAGENNAYRFNGYEIGNNPSKGSIRSTYYATFQSRPVYGDGGIWTAWSGASVPGGTVVFLDTDLRIASGAVFEVCAGSRVVNAGFMILSGTIIEEGDFENNGIVERRDSGSVEGEVEGSGFTATCIYARPNEGRVEVMTITDDAVVLRTASGDIVFELASVRFYDRGETNQETEVIVRAVNGQYSAGGVFVVALEQVPLSEGSSSWVLGMTGFALGNDAFTVDVRVPGWVPEGHLPVVTDGQGRTMEVVSHGNGSVVFRAVSNGTYTLAMVPEEDVNKGPFSDPLVINSVIAAAIVVVAAVAVYFLLRRD